MVSTGRPGIWGEFAANSRKHLRSVQTNGLGLTQFLAYRDDGRHQLMSDPLLPDHDAPWTTRLETAERELRPVHWLAVAAYLLLLALAVRGRPDWVAAVLGLGSMAMLFALSTYYCSAYVAFGALASFSPGAGFALAVLTWVTNVIAGLGLEQDKQYAWLSLAVVVFVVGVTGVFGWPRRAPDRDDDPGGR